ncbi:class A sortase, partial [Enterococcus faecium]|nr:class A sortase [Enterococcus faecium]
MWLLSSLILAICGFYGYIVLLRPENTIKQAQQITHPIQSEKEIKEIQQTTIGKATYNENQIQPVTP